MRDMLLLSSMFDLLTRKVPNALVAFAGGIGLLVSVLPNSGTSFYMAVASFSIGLLLFLPPFLMNALGAADVKIFAVSGLFMSPLEVVSAFFYTLLSGGILALIYFFIARVRKLEIAHWKVFQSNSLDSKESGVTLPYVVAIFFGVLIVNIVINTNN